MRVLLKTSRLSGALAVGCMLIVSGGALADNIYKYRSADGTILFTDQSVRFALKHARRAYILEKGRVVHEASSDELRADQATQDRFLSVA